MATWTETIVEALQSLGGTASFPEIFEKVKEIRPDLPKTWREIIRRVLHENSSDSKAFRGTNDIFYQDGEGHSGRWGLRAIEELQHALETAPRQEIGGNVTISSGKIVLADLDPEQDGNDYNLIAVLHEDLLDSTKVALGLLSSLHNIYPNLASTFSRYHKSIDCEVRTINFTKTYLRGLDLDAELSAVKSAIKNDSYGEYPPLSQKQEAAISRVVLKHGPFIASSVVGGELIDAAARYRRTPREELEYKDQLLTAAEYLQAQNEVVDNEITDLIIKNASVPIGDQTELRKTAVSGRVVRNVLVLTGAILSVASFAAMGGFFFGTQGGLLATILSGYIVKKPYEKSTAHKEIGAGITNAMNKVSEGELEIINRISDFAKDARNVFYPIAEASGIEEWFNEIHGLEKPVVSSREIDFSDEKQLDDRILELVQKIAPQSKSVRIGTLKKELKMHVKMDVDDFAREYLLKGSFENYLFQKHFDKSTPPYLLLGSNYYSTVFMDTNEARKQIDRSIRKVREFAKNFLRSYPLGLTMSRLSSEIATKIPQDLAYATTLQNLLSILLEDAEIMEFEDKKFTTFDEKLRKSFPTKYYKFLPR